MHCPDMEAMVFVPPLPMLFESSFFFPVILLLSPCYYVKAADLEAWFMMFAQASMGDLIYPCYCITTYCNITKADEGQVACLYFYY